MLNQYCLKGPFIQYLLWLWTIPVVMSSQTDVVEFESCKYLPDREGQIKDWDPGFLGLDGGQTVSSSLPLEHLIYIDH